MASRLAPSSLLAQATRGKVFDAMRARPGAGVAALARSVALAESVVRYHARLLERAGLATSARSGSRLGFFPVGLAPGAWAQDGTAARLDARIAASERAWTQRELAAACGVSERLVSYHLRGLARQGRVRVVEGRPRRYARATACLAYP